MRTIDADELIALFKYTDNKNIGYNLNLNEIIEIINSIETLESKDQDEQEDEIVDDEFNIGSSQFIWGILSGDDICGSQKAHFYTLNDLDIIFDRENLTYSLSIETIYGFPTEENRKNYLKELLNKLTLWMNQQGYDTNYEAKNIYSIFTYGLNINSNFESIPQLYGTFKFLVEAYCNN